MDTFVHEVFGDHCEDKNDEEHDPAHCTGVAHFVVTESGVVDIHAIEVGASLGSTTGEHDIGLSENLE